MLRNIKNFLYFPVARYFLFFAGIYLRRWKPTVIVVTGSAGKTTLLHLIESQIGERGKYSHKANSSFGIPFDVLGLRRETLLKSEWFRLFLFAPVRAFRAIHREKVYVVEADCDRPYEGKFLASFLRPDVVLWVSVARTHGMNFERLVEEGIFKNVEEAIAFEFGYFLEYCGGVVMINGDSDLMRGQVGRTKAKVVEVRRSGLEEYRVGREGTVFVVGGKRYVFKVLLPEEVFYSLSMCVELMGYLHFETDVLFKNFSLPPGRSSIFSGIRDTIIIDCSYNVDLSSAKAVLDMFARMGEKQSWVVVGDILEQGMGEREEHERLAELLKGYDFERIILMGPRVCKYTYPRLEIAASSRKIGGTPRNDKIVRFEGPKEALDYLLENLRGGEMVLFKGARFMEGIIEHLLLDKGDVNKLARRERVWEKRRRSFGL
jgi:UDP-N-acetylmuramyl pentapeptide synthase